MFNHVYNSGLTPSVFVSFIQTFNKEKRTPLCLVSTHKPTAVSRRGDKLSSTSDPSLHQGCGTLPRSLQGPWSCKLEMEGQSGPTLHSYWLAWWEYCGHTININNERDDFHYLGSLQPPWAQPPSLQIDETLSYKRLISFGHQAGVLTWQFLNANSIVDCSQGNFALFSSSSFLKELTRMQCQRIMTTTSYIKMSDIK